MLEYDIRAEDLARQLYSDINSNIDKWAAWDIFTIHKFQYWKEFACNWAWLKIALWKLKRKFDKDERDYKRRFERAQKRMSKRAHKTKILSPKEKI